MTALQTAPAPVNGRAPAPRLSWTTVDVADLDGAPEAEHIDAPDWVLPGLLERQSRLLLAGDEGVGKSLFLAQIAVRLASGMPVTPDSDGPDPLRVLVVDTELNERTARRRLRPMAAHAGLRAGHLTYLLAPAGLDLLRDQERQQIVQLVESIRPHVIALDSLYRAFNGDPDDPRVAGQVQRVLDEVRAGFGASLIIVCHYRKRPTDGRQRRNLDDLAGSRAWKAWPECAADITRDRIRILKDREGQAVELAIARRDAGTWETDPEGWPFDLSTIEPTRAQWRGHTVIAGYALAVLARSDAPLSTKRVADLVAEDRATEGRTAFNRGNVSTALGELLDRRQVDKQPGPRGANIWSITAAGLEAVSVPSQDPPW